MLRPVVDQVHHQMPENVFARLTTGTAVMNDAIQFFLAEVLLPFYLLLQPVFALGNAFEWKDRRLTVKTAETSEGQG